jgi:hypothetical protein
MDASLLRKMLSFTIGMLHWGRVQCLPSVGEMRHKDRGLFSRQCSRFTAQAIAAALSGWRET